MKEYQVSFCIGSMYHSFIIELWPFLGAFGPAAS